MMSAAERLAKVEAEIAEACRLAGRERSSVELIGVTKKKNWDEIRPFLSLGLKLLGENYVQEAMAKLTLARNETADCQWHFIGNLQSNKARFIPNNFSLFHALDSLPLAQKIDRFAAEAGIVQSCLVEVNVDGEKSKAGVRAEALPLFLEKLSALPNLRVRGLMTIPSPRPTSESRAPFALLRELLDRCQKQACYRDKITELSMGMSADFSAAILEGATYVRVGTALFGERA